MAEVYVAFSIHRSNCFITANKQVDKKPSGTVTIDGIDFTVVKSRDGNSRNNAAKLETKDLTDKGVPFTDANKVFAFFDRLRENGWKVEDEGFIRLHKIEKPKKLKAKEEPKPEPVAEKPPETTAPVPQPEALPVTETPPVTAAVPVTEIPKPRQGEPATPGEHHPAATDATETAIPPADGIPAAKEIPTEGKPAEDKPEEKSDDKAPPSDTPETRPDAPPTPDKVEPNASPNDTNHKSDLNT